MKVLIIVAHPDDELLGCGGTAIRLQKEGNVVENLILGKGRGDILDNAFDTEPFLSFIQIIENKIQAFGPDIIFTHFEHDLNIDHRITYQAAITACRPIRGHHIVKEIYSFEIISNTEWSITPFQPDTFYDITGLLEEKIKNLGLRYPGEMRQWPHPRSAMGVRYLALYRGMQSGCEYAEAFKTVRRIL